MASQEKEEIKKNVQGQLERLRDELENLKQQSGTFTPDRAHGRMGKIDAIQNKGFHERSIRSLENKINGLEKNLQDLDSPDFGICERCEGPIGKERREALPEARTCIKCAANRSL